MEIIVPAAGKSTRFPDMKPKFLLYDYKGELMIANAVRPWIGKENITVVLLEEHNEKWDAIEHIKNQIPLCNFVLLDKPTNGPAETVYRALKTFDDSVGVFIKDCDSFFDCDIGLNNSICISKIQNHKILKDLSSKSFVQFNNQDIAINIIEKQVISDTFCVGGYKFQNSNDFILAYESLTQKHKGEIFVSHIIDEAIINIGIEFFKNVVTDYIDVGTSDDWFEYNNKPTIFCDIDGTLIEAQSRYGKNSYHTTPKIIQENVDIIMKQWKNGSQIIFTTSRPRWAQNETAKLLDEMGFRNCVLLMELNNSTRILINDYDSNNPWPRAKAFNIKRNANNLKDFL